jgi:hypothetical protein
MYHRQRGGEILGVARRAIVHQRAIAIIDLRRGVADDHESQRMVANEI